MRAPTGGGVCTRDGARLEGGEEVRETKIVVGDAVLPRNSHAHIDEAAQSRLPAADHRGPTPGANPTNSFRSSGRSRQGYRHLPNRVTPWPPLATGCRASYAYASEMRDNSRASIWYAPCSSRSLME